MADGKSILTRTPLDRFREFVTDLGHAYLPQTCLLCGGPGGSAPLCPACQADLPSLPGFHCPHCLEATTHGERCGACLAHPPHYDQLLALHGYAFPLDRLIHGLKFHGAFGLASFWGQRLAQVLKSENIVSAAHEPVRIMALPLHGERLAERGYNQSTLLAQEVAQALDYQLDQHSLHKWKSTAQQAELDHKKRRKNIKGAFSCTQDLSGATLVLVDDVLTTGATLDEAARVLKLAGAERVIGLVVARTPRH